MEDVLPYALGGPVDEAVVERLTRAVDRRNIRPAPARLQHMDDPADHTTIIHARLASGVARKVRLKLPKLLHRQPELTVAHKVPLSRELNHNSPLRERLFMGPDPKVCLL